MKPDEERIRQEILGAVVRRTVNTPAPPAPAPPEEPAPPGATGDTPPSAPPADPRPGPPSHNRGRPVLLAVVAIVVVALVMVYVLKGRTGDLAGSVYAKNRGGEIKRAADTEVWVIPVSNELQAALKRIEEQYKRAWGPAKASYNEAHAARAGADRALEALHGVNDSYTALAVEALRSRKKYSARTTIDGAYRFIGLDRGDYIVFAQFSWLGAATADAGLDSEIALAQLRQQRARLELKEAARQLDLGGIQAKGAEGSTAIEEEYALKREKLLQEQWHERRPAVTWLVRTTVRSGDNHLELSGSNSGWPFDP